jgi:signal transduction histidine kinase
MSENLFDSLVSVRDQNSEKPHLGLGLFVVKRVAEFHRGRVEARNLPKGEGVEFILWLPVSRN